MAGPTEARCPTSGPTWQEGLPELDVVALVVVGTQADDLHRTSAHRVAELCPHSVLATAPGHSDYPWLVEPEEVLRLLTDLFGTLD